MLIAGIAIAGALGAPSRFLVDGYVQEHTSGERPVGTLAINITGSFILGLLTGLTLYHAFPSTPKIILGTGFCGAYTTFSTFTYETARLTEEGELSNALRNLVLSLLLPALAAAAGWALAAA
jgi:fluoride exporter